MTINSKYFSKLTFILIILIAVLLTAGCSNSNSTSINTKNNNEKSTNSVAEDTENKSSSLNILDDQNEFRNFIISLQESEYRKSAEESGYECIYDGQIEDSNFVLFYNQSCFEDEDFIYFVLVEKNVESFYEVDLDSDLYDKFAKLLTVSNSSQ